MKSILTIIALANSNAVYEWGGNFEYSERLESIVCDCSGYVLKVLRDYGIKLPDMTSQGLYEYCTKNALQSSTECDSLLFFGENEGNITHVAISIGNGFMIEAGGSGKESLKMSKKDLINKDARVRVRPIENRKDLISGYLLKQAAKHLP